jgi:hypothetical protein
MGAVIHIQAPKNMKTLRILLTLTFATTALHAQGTVFFTNRSTGPYVESPIYYPDGISLARAGSVYVQLWAGPEVGSLAPISVPVLLGPRDGYFYGGEVSIPTVAPGQRAWLQVLAWEVGASGLDDARTKGLLWGESNVFSLPLGGPPNLVPFPLLGLHTMTLVPEPGPGAQLALGGGLWLLLARRRAEERGAS